MKRKHKLHILCIKFVATYGKQNKLISAALRAREEKQTF